MMIALTELMMMEGMGICWEGRKTVCMVPIINGRGINDDRNGP